MGRPTTPKALKILRGTQATSRQARKKLVEPEPTIGMPPIPQHLDDEAKTEWARISDELFRLGLLTFVDRGALAAYCVAWSRWVSAEKEVTKYGIVIQGKRSPWLVAAQAAMDQMLSAMREFGMTPASRAKVATAKPTEGKASKMDFLA